MIFSPFVTVTGSYSKGGKDFSATIVLSAIWPIWYSERANVATVSRLVTSKKVIPKSATKVQSKTKKAFLFYLILIKKLLHFSLILFC